MVIKIFCKSLDEELKIYWKYREYVLKTFLETKNFKQKILTCVHKRVWKKYSQKLWK